MPLETACRRIHFPELIACVHLRWAWASAAVDRECELALVEDPSVQQSGTRIDASQGNGRRLPAPDVDGYGSAPREWNVDLLEQIYGAGLPH